MDFNTIKTAEELNKLYKQKYPYTPYDSYEGLADIESSERGKIIKVLIQKDSSRKVSLTRYMTEHYTKFTAEDIRQLSLNHEEWNQISLYSNFNYEQLELLVRAGLPIAKVKNAISENYYHPSMNTWLKIFLVHEDSSVEKQIYELPLSFNTISAENLELAITKGLSISYIIKKSTYNPNIEEINQSVFFDAIFNRHMPPIEIRKVILKNTPPAFNVNEYIEASPSYFLHPDSEDINTLSDILLSDVNHPLSANNLLKLAFYSDQYESGGNDDNKLILFKKAVALGAKVNLIPSSYLSTLTFKFLQKAKELLFNNTENSLALDDFFKLVLHSPYTVDEIPQKVILVKEVLDQGADINTFIINGEILYLGVKFLNAVKDTLLSNKDNPLSKHNFLKLAWHSTGSDDEMTQKVILVKEALDAGTDINSYLNHYYPNTNIKFLVAIADLLLNNGKNSISANNFLKTILSISTSNDDEIKQQIDLLKTALKEGANIDSVLSTYTPCLSLKFLAAAENLLFNNENNGKNSISANNFLKIILNTPTYNEEVSLKVDLLKIALKEGANIDRVLSTYTPSLSLKFLAAAESLLLHNGKNSISANNYLKIILSISTSNDDEISQKISLLKAALGAGANINDAIASNIPDNLSLQFLQAAEEVLFNSGLNSISADNFLKLILAIEPNNQQAIIQQRQLLEEAVNNRKSNVNNIVKTQGNLYVSVKTIEYHKEFLLSESPIPATPNNFLKLILKQNDINLDDLKLQKKLIEEALDLKADINKVVAQTDYGMPLIMVAFFKDVLFGHITPDNYIQLVLRSFQSGQDDSEFAELKYQLIKYCLDNGADVNYNAEGHTVLEDAKEPKIIELIQSYGGKCGTTSFDELREGGLSHLLLNPGFILEQKYKNLGAIKAEKPKMPYTVSHIWLTHPSVPSEIRNQDIANVIETKKLFNETSNNWQHIVWTNDRNLIPGSLKTLEEAGVKVESIYDYKEDLKLFELIESLIAEKKWGMASDTLRYSLIEHFGGVYADLNFIFARDLIDEVHKYNFFTMSYGGFYIDNFFFGASAKHPIIERVLYLVERNLVNPPSYLSNIINQNSRAITDMGTANPTYLAYYKEANKGGNIDVVYPLVPKSLIDEEAAIGDFPSDEDMDPEQRAEYEAESKAYMQKCPELLGYEFASNYLIAYEMCGLEYHGIGHDSSDGLTWL